MNGTRLIATWASAALLIAMTAGWTPLVAWLEAHDKLAGWAQAIGVVVTIAAGFVYIAVQHELAAKAAKESRRLARRAVLHAVQIAFSDAMAVAIVAHGEVSDPAPAWDQVSEEVRRVQAQLESITLLQMEDPGVMHRAGMVKAGLMRMRDLCDKLAALPFGPAEPARARRFFNERIDVFDRLHLELHNLIEACSTHEEREQDRKIMAEALAAFEYQDALGAAEDEVNAQPAPAGGA